MQGITILKFHDINEGIGTHLAIENGLVKPGGTFVSTDSHANIIGAIGAFGQGMGDMDIAAVWAKGKAWFKVPPSIKMNFIGNRPRRNFSKRYCPEFIEYLWCQYITGIFHRNVWGGYR